MSDEQRVYIRGETVPVWAYVQDWSDVYVDPTSVTLDLYDPDNEIVLDGVTMTKDAVGKYVYYWNTDEDDKAGWYTGIATITNGTGEGAKKTMPVGVFKIK